MSVFYLGTERSEFKTKERQKLKFVKCTYLEGNYKSIRTEGVCMCIGMCV